MRSLIVIALLASGCTQASTEESLPPRAAPQAGALRLPASGVSVRMRTGNNVEGLATIFHTPLLSALAALDGYDVVALLVPNTPPSRSLPSLHFKLFDLRAAAAADGQPPRGIAFDPGRRQFYVGPGLGGPNPVIRVVDAAGRERPSIPVTLLPGQVVPLQFEGLAYLPPGLPRFGDRIAAVLAGEDGFGRISIIRLDGVVEHEIPVVPGTPADNYITGLAFEAPGTLLFTPLSTVGSEVYRIDFEGNVTGPVLVGGPLDSYEGLAVLPGGRIAATEYVRGRLLLFDAAGGRLPHQDRDFHVGFGVSVLDGVAWDGRGGRMLVNGISGGGGARREVFALGARLSGATQITHLQDAGIPASGGLAWFADDGTVALCQTGPRAVRGVWFVDAATGEYRSRLSLGLFDPQAEFRARRAALLPGGEVAVRVSQRPELLQIVTRTGTPDPADPTAVVPQLVRTVTLAPAPPPGGLDFDAVSGNLLVSRVYYDHVGNAVGPLTGVPADFQGQVFHHLTQGRFAGQIAGVDPNSSELVIFRR